MFRHGRAAYLSRHSEDENRGVQSKYLLFVLILHNLILPNAVSIPLSRVKTFTQRRALKYAFLLRVELSSGSVRTSLSDNGVDESDGEKQDGSPRSSEDGELDMDGQAIELCISQNPHAWDDFGRLVEEAKERERRAGVRVPPEVTVDFGALSFVERREEARKSEDDKEESIRNALSLEPEGEIWCKCIYITLFFFLDKLMLAFKRYARTNHKEYMLFWIPCHLQALHWILDEMPLYYGCEV